MPSSAADRTATIRFEGGALDRCSVELSTLALRISAGPDAGRRESFALDVVRIGKAPDNDLVLDDPGVSRSHAAVRVTEEGLKLRDLGSKNGTFVVGQRIEEVFLAPGQSFRVGASEITVEARRESRAAVLEAPDRLGDLVGSSPAMRELYGVLRAVAPTHATVLIQGESGTGKELVARTLHGLSGRPGPLVVFDAASTDPEMMRSDLFGHLEGAFTGASRAREGAFRRAHGGTLFVDEIGELPLELQARLLRVLESREVQPLGGDAPEPVDVRVVSATHRDLAAKAREGSFRQDLFHRLAVVPVRAPALRERAEDMDLLVDHLSATLGLSCTLSPAARDRLRAHDWPGNVRELRNVLERAGALHAGEVVGPEDLVFHVGPEPPPPSATPAPGRTMAEVERATILAALARNGDNQSAAARELGISLSTLRRRLKEYGEEDASES